MGDPMQRHINRQVVHFVAWSAALAGTTLLGKYILPAEYAIVLGVALLVFWLNMLAGLTSPIVGVDRERHLLRRDEHKDS